MSAAWQRPDSVRSNVVGQGFLCPQVSGPLDFVL